MSDQSYSKALSKLMGDHFLEAIRESQASTYILNKMFAAAVVRAHPGVDMPVVSLDAAGDAYAVHSSEEDRWRWNEVLNCMVQVPDPDTLDAAYSYQRDTEPLVFGCSNVLTHDRCSTMLCPICASQMPFSALAEKVDEDESLWGEAAMWDTLQDATDEPLDVRLARARAKR